MDDGILARPPIRYVTPIGSDSYAIAFPIVVQPLLLLFDIYIYIYIGRRSATIRTALLSLLCTRRFFTCKMMSKANPAPPNGHLVLEFRLSGSKGFKEERKLEENTFEEKDRPRNSSRFDRVY